MSKPFTYWVRLAMVATMCTLVTFSPVSAGRWMDRLLHRDACKTTTMDCCESIVPCETSCLVVPSAPCVDVTQPACCPAASLGCDSMPGLPLATESVAPTVESSSLATPSVVPPVVDSTPVPVVEQAPVVEAPKVAMPKADTPAPVVEKPAPVVETPAPVVENVPIAEPVPVVPEPKPVLEAAPPVSNPFAQDTKPPEVKTAEPGEAKQKDLPVDDLFGTEPKPAAPVTPAPVDDLFGADPKPVAPATAQPIDDLFGADPKPATPATPAPVDDLFGADPKPVVPEAAEPVESKPSDSVDDLFKTKDKPVADPSIDDLFGKPIAIEANLSNEKSKAIDEDDAFIDSLFGKSAETSETAAPKQEAIEAPSTLPEQAKPRSEKSPIDELDSLFGVGEFKPASEFKGAEYRLWVDNSGAYQINARLAVIYVDKIKLLKDNGKFTTVPLSRLSDADFGYVSWVASNLTGEQTARMVKTESTTADSDLSR